MTFDNGQLCKENQLQSDKAAKLVKYLKAKHNGFAVFNECRTSDAKDIVCFTVEPELSQIKVNDIKPCELVAVHFDKADMLVPAVYALREDFPRNIPHLNLEDEGRPASLCLYGEAYKEIKPYWTAARFVERIREWLTETAKGTLHGEDQPLEPLIFGYGCNIILPQSLYESPEDGFSVRRFILQSSGEAYQVIHIDDLPEGYKIDTGKPPPTAFCVKLPPQEHGVINHTPKNLYDVSKFMNNAGYDLFPAIFSALKNRNLVIDDTILNSPFAIIAWFPKQRSSTSEPETTDIWVFLTTKTVADVFEDIGVYSSFFQNQNGKNKRVTSILINRHDSKNGENTEVLLLNPTFTLSSSLAAILNGHQEPLDPKVFAIGVGAIGSNIISNSIKAGFGKWVLIDDDIILPHNIARYALDGTYLGWPKTEAVKIAANESVSDQPVIEALKCDIISPKDDLVDKVKKHISESSIILDMSASVSVARHITHDIESDARRISVFLSPSGKDLIILSEDKDRKARLDLLEMLYYRELISNDTLVDHLETILKTRYANSCRDLSSRISQDHVALHSAIASKNLKQIAGHAEPCIKIYRTDDDMQVTSLVVPVEQFLCAKLNGWQVFINDSTCNKLQQSRQLKLPNETGGVLIGAFNIQHKIIYIVDVMTATPDSIEYPDAFIRGYEGLPEKVKKIQSITAGNLTYIGEWHSHPDGAQCRPSSDDKKVQQWIASYMSAEGLPSVMLIAGENNKLCFCIDNEIKVMEFEDVRESIKATV